MGASPWATVVLPTLGRSLPGLSRTLDSIEGQEVSAEGVEVLVVADTHSGPQWHVHDLVERRRSERVTYRCISHDGGLHAWGQPQRQAGMAAARGQWLLWCADDDILTPTALRDVRSAIERLDGTLRPLVFRFVAPAELKRLVIPTAPVLRAANVDASCLVVPNVPSRLGDWTNTYEGDYDFLASTAELWGGPESLRWCSPIVCFARPDPKDDWPSLWRRAADGEYVRLNIGCGDFPLPGELWTAPPGEPVSREGWVNVDSSRNAGGADFHLRVPPIPLPDDSVAEVYCGHVLEHLCPEEGHALLMECRRVLRPGGRVGVLVPDTREILTRYLTQTGDVVEAPEGLFHHMDDLDHVCRLFLYSTMQESPHLHSYDSTTLRRALKLAGLRPTEEIDRYHDPRIPVHTWYGLGYDAIKPGVGH